MKQILQNLRTGNLQTADLPCPKVRPGQVLIQTRSSLISPGTERMLVEFSQANLLQKARRNPERVRQVLDKLKTDGLLPTLEAVFRRLDEPLPLGYCNAGVVLEVGSGVHDLQPGDRVASNGPHAEMVCVPRNLCAEIPDGLGDEEAAFTVLGAIALQGTRLARPTFGEGFVVFGMGLVGLLTVQLLRASGCRVLAVDMNTQRLKLAETFGATTVHLERGEDPIEAAQTWTLGHGVDGALITASARDDEIVHQAAQVCRKRGRIVLVGVVNLNLQRSDFYEKELTFQVSCSYGPGRYDDDYELEGHDYPQGFVRWTERRNFEAVLQALQSSALRVGPLVTDRVDLSEAADAYQKIQDGNALGILLKYSGQADPAPTVSLHSQKPAAAASPTVGLIGVGAFARSTLLPALAKTRARLAWVANRDPAPAHQSARKYGAEQMTSDHRAILEDEAVSAVFIAVGHHLHAQLVCQALQAGKHVFVEKPLCLSPRELEQVLTQVRNRSENFPALLMVGFNRRFSPHTHKAKTLLQGRSGALAMNATINAGAVPADHWTQDPLKGGGRIIGEACHFIDLMVFLTGSTVRTVAATRVGEDAAIRDDKMSITLGFEDGSIGTLNYFANGTKSYPKESVEIFGDGRVIRIENFRRTRAFGRTGGRPLRTWRQDKGHQAEIKAFVDLVATGGAPLIPLAELVNVTLASFAAVASAREERTILLTDEYPTFWPLEDVESKSEDRP